MKIVIADDHALVRDGIRWMLVNEPGIEIVGEAVDGAGLLDLLGRIEVDVVLLDIRMPEKSGLDVLAELADWEDAPAVLVLSMYHEPALVEEAIALGAAGFIPKSAGRDQLVLALRTVGSGDSYLSGELVTPLVTRIEDGLKAVAPLLDPAERAVVRLLAEGLVGRHIAARLDIDPSVLRSRLRSIFKKLGVHSRSEAVAAAHRLGIID